MSLLVVGSVALDTVETPHGKADEVLGGSAVYFSLAASLFTRVALAGVVGEDFPQAWRNLLLEKGIDLSGLQVLPGKTFRWSGKYEGDMNQATTLAVQLNVFGDYNGQLPSHLRSSEYVFLANGSPVLQRAVASQMSSPRLVVCDTMNHWIASHKTDLDRILSEIDGVVMNEGEARMYTGETNLVSAARRLLDCGVKFAVVKKGEHGAIGATRQAIFSLPSVPLEIVKDPTGAGDSFGGAMMGCLASQPNFTLNALKRAVAYGCVVASFTVEDFSVKRLASLTRAEADQRLSEYSRMLCFDDS